MATHTSLHCYYQENKKEFIDALKSSVAITLMSDPFFHQKVELAKMEYDGTEESFRIAAGNISANKKLKSYGIHSIGLILECAADIFEELMLAKVSSFVLSHYGHVLLRMENKSPYKSLAVTYLDIADLLDQIKAPFISSTIQELTEKVENIKLIQESRNSPTLIWLQQHGLAFESIGKQTLLVNSLMLISFIGVAFLSYQIYSK